MPDPAALIGIFSDVGHTNTDQRQVNWHFTTTDARIKLRHLYPEH